MRDTDPAETNDWMECFDAVVEYRGRRHAAALLKRLLDHSGEGDLVRSAPLTTPYLNTVPASRDIEYPGNLEQERRVRAFTRWNATAMVIRANARHPGVGGHLSTFASTATLYDVAWNHFFRGKDALAGGDLVYFQPHAAPGVYARAFLEGRISAEHLDGFRCELQGGLPAYPHPRMMPDFWEVPTASMGLGPMMAVHQARLVKLLAGRGVDSADQRRIWCFVGDGETDEPECRGSLAVAGREQLDNLIFVVNCNLQRLDGPVRGNGKIVQELEGLFIGAGWRVVKLLWGSSWDELFAHDDGTLLERVTSAVDGEVQRLSVSTGSEIREEFFGTDDRLRSLVDDLDDDQLRTLPRGGHDPRKIYSAFSVATERCGRPTVVLAHTVKGWALGSEIEARNSTHQMKNMTGEQLRALLARLDLDTNETEVLGADVTPLDEPLYRRPLPDSDQHRFLRQVGAHSEGFTPQRRAPRQLVMPVSVRSMIADIEWPALPMSTFDALSTIVARLSEHPHLARRVVNLYAGGVRLPGTEPAIDVFDSTSSLAAMFVAAATSYANQQSALLPFAVAPSSALFARAGDVIWASGDVLAKGFLIGTSAGATPPAPASHHRVDSHSPIQAATLPTLRVYDVAFAYELAAIVADGAERILGSTTTDALYYLMVHDDLYEMPPIAGTNPAATAREIAEATVRQSAVTRDVLRGMHKLQPEVVTLGSESRRTATIMFSGATWPHVQRAAVELSRHHEVEVALFSVTSYKALREDALAVERWNRLHPTARPRIPFIQAQLETSTGPVIAVTDHVSMVSDQVARWIPRTYVSLGADGRDLEGDPSTLRRHYGIDTDGIVDAVLRVLDAERQESVNRQERSAGQSDAVTAAVGN